MFSGAVHRQGYPEYRWSVLTLLNFYLGFFKNPVYCKHNTKILRKLLSKKFFKLNKTILNPPVSQDEDIQYECVVTCKVRRRGEDDMSTLVPHPLPPGRDDLTEQEINHLMSVIANMESVKGVGGREEEKQSPPPTDDELREFIDYVGMGVVNQDRVDYEEQRQDEGQPEPPKRSKQANQYFWRRHYLSIIQEEEEHADQSQGSSRANSRPASTYENNMFRMPRILSISPLCTVEQRGREEKRDSRESWESEMSVESLTSINSILSEEGSITSSGSFQSDTCQEKSNSRDTEGGRRAYESLSCLLDSVPPPSNTPDSMVIDPSISKPCLSEINPVSRIRTGMGSRFKQQLQEIEERKLNEGKRELNKTRTQVYTPTRSDPTQQPLNNSSLTSQGTIEVIFF